jgi:hypothetical protein
MMTTTSGPLTPGQDPETTNRMGIVPPPRLRRRDRSPRTLTEAHAVSVLKSGRLTERDLKVVDTVWKLGAMTSAQIRRLAYHTLSNEACARRVVNRRLRFLYEEHVLDRIILSLNSLPVYVLDEQGARVIQMLHQAQGRKEIRWSPRSVGESILFMDHRLGVAEFMVSLTEATRRQGGSLQWTGEAMLNLSKRDGTSFRPDGGGIIKMTDSQFLQFFFEWDRGQETLKTIAGKIRNYLDFFNRPEAWKSRCAAFPALLIVTTAGSERLHNILAGTTRLMERLKVKPDMFRVWVANWADLEQGTILEPVWYQAGKTTAEEFTWKKGRALLAP